MLQLKQKSHRERVIRSLSQMATTVAFAIAAGGALADTFSPAAGGNGGGPFQAHCGANHSVITLIIRGGAWIDAAEPACSSTRAATDPSPRDEWVVEPFNGGQGAGGWS
jgi:hypothetical protein